MPHSHIAANITHQQSLIKQVLLVTTGQHPAFVINAVIRKYNFENVLHVILCSNFNTHPEEFPAPLVTIRGRKKETNDIS